MIQPAKPMKLGTRKCKVCKTVFQKTTPLHCLCSGACAITHLKAAGEKRVKQERTKERAETKKKLIALKSINDLIKEAQSAFNAYIRERDKDQLCICCDKPYGTNAIGGDFDCGHYRSRGAAGHLRFNEDNAFGQRKYCNTYLSGNVQGMRRGMIKRIGMEKVLAIENNNMLHKWMREELIEIKRAYKLKLKELKQEKAKLAA